MEATEQQLERMAFDDAVASALQSIGDAAVAVQDATVEEYPDTIIVRLGPFQDLTSAIDAARALGWKTTDEALDAQDLFYAKGTGR